MSVIDAPPIEEICLPCQRNDHVFCNGWYTNGWESWVCVCEVVEHPQRRPDPEFWAGSGYTRPKSGSSQAGN